MSTQWIAEVFLLAENRLLREALVRLLAKKNDVRVVGANPYSPAVHEEIIAAGENGMRTETRYVRSDGSGGWTELYRRALVTGGGLVVVTTARDVTERRAQQEKIERLSRVHAVLSGINAAIVRIRDREELFRESCRIAHEAGGYDAVWIGLTGRQQTVVEPVAWQGQEERVRRLTQGRFSLQDEGEGGQSLL